MADDAIARLRVAANLVEAVRVDSDHRLRQHGTIDVSEPVAGSICSSRLVRRP
jgi:hypothetical protein